MHRQAVELDELTRLTEYHLKDQEKDKINVEYLNKLELTSKHNRLTPKLRNRETIFMADFSNFQKMKKTSEIRNDRQLETAFKMAKKNQTFPTILFES